MELEGSLLFSPISSYREPVGLVLLRIPPFIFGFSRKMLRLNIQA